MKRFLLMFSILVSMLFLSCKAKTDLSNVQLSATQSIQILDSLQASEAIVTDKVDHFFEKITLTEMQIQMKNNFPKGMTKEQALKEYIQFMKTEVSDFTEDEKAFVTEVMNEAFETCNAVNPTIFPSQIRLIKTKANHYGYSVYYTRENCIIIPQNVLISQNEHTFLETIFHEIFHIYSRYNEDKRHELYELIGFENIGNSQELKMDTLLSSRLLHNPDGVNFAYKIDLQDTDNQTVSCVPIITANADGYIPQRNAFFNYLKFSLYQIEKKDVGYQVLTDKEGNSTIDMDKTNFYDVIKDNTNYIIHPDEVLADNFMYLMHLKQGNKNNLAFSKEGDQLLKDIEAILIQ